MAEVLLFHHVQGLTPGVRAFADELRAAGHTVHTPDLFEGKVFASLDAGMAYVGETTPAEIRRRALRSVEDLHDGLVLGGFSLGAMRAQELAQTRPGVRGALLVSSCVPVSGESAFGAWPPGVPVQVHGMASDPFFADEGDLEAARELAATVPDAEVFVYPGEEHLFADSSLPSYDAAATRLLLSRVLDLLARV